jgi:hypothetical protein
MGSEARQSYSSSVGKGEVLTVRRRTGHMELRYDLVPVALNAVSLLQFSTHCQNAHVMTKIAKHSVIMPFCETS